jgi:histone H1/5
MLSQKNCNHNLKLLIFTKMSVVATKKTYLQLASEAIASLQERNGSSKPAIVAWIEARYSGIELSPRFLRAALKRGVESSKLVQVKQSFKLAPTQRKVTLTDLEKEGEKLAKKEAEKQKNLTTRSGKVVSPVKKVGAKSLPKAKTSRK